jgi:hypothetical protein
MALFAHRVAQRGRQPSGVYDGELPAPMNVQFGRPVTALATNRVPLEHRHHKAVGDFGILAYAVGVTE